MIRIGAAARPFRGRQLVFQAAIEDCELRRLGTRGVDFASVKPPITAYAFARTTIHKQLRAGDEAAVVGGQEHDDLRDLVRVADSSSGTPADLLASH